MEHAPNFKETKNIGVEKLDLEVKILENPTLKLIKHQKPGLKRCLQKKLKPSRTTPWREPVLTGKRKNQES